MKSEKEIRVVPVPKRYIKEEDYEKVGFAFFVYLNQQVQKLSSQTKECIMLNCDLTDDILVEASGYITIEEGTKKDFENVFKALCKLGKKKFNREDMKKFANEYFSKSSTFRDFVAKLNGEVVGRARLNLPRRRAIVEGLTDEVCLKILVIEMLECYIREFCDTLGIKEITFDCLSPYEHEVKYRCVDGNWDIVSRRSNFAEV